MSDFTRSAGFRTSVQEISGCEQAARRAALSYQVQGLAGVEVFELAGEWSSRADTRSMWAVKLSALSRIECVIDDDADLEVAVRQLTRFQDAGWKVWALVPLRRLAGAHRVFQPVAEYVQGWWASHDSIAFTAPEIP
jgi:hypothetical protein